MSPDRPHLLVTTSWDDGAAQDARLADLLARHAAPATFYVPRSNPERAVIGERGVRNIAQQFEIGAHTLGHVDLTSLDASRGASEVAGSKRWLEDLLGRSVRSFCFPRGRYHAAALGWVEQAGFEIARTADWFRDRLGHGVPLILRPTIHVYPQPLVVHVAHSVRTCNWASFGHYLPLALGSWENLARRAFDSCLRRGGVFHLWGHSWEIDELDLWAPLERLLEHITGHADVAYVTNGELAGIAKNAP